MFDISWSELLLIAVVALVFIGPKELPGVLRTVGQWTGKVRRMATEFQDQFREAIREAEVADLKKDIDEATSKLNVNLDPFAGVHESTEWKRSEPTTGATTASPPPAADAPPAPPAEAIEPVTTPAEATSAEAAPPAPAAPAPEAPATEPAASAAPHAGGGQAA